MRKIIFSDEFFNDKIKCNYIDLRSEDSSKNCHDCNEKQLIPTGSVLNKFSNHWGKEFSQWLGLLNSYEHDVYWWAHTSTAKNLLSSPFGERFFQVKAVCEIIDKYDKEVICIVGATPGQINSIVSIYSDLQVEYYGGSYKHTRKVILNNITTLLRIFLQCGSIFLGFLGRCNLKTKSKADICIFTYLHSKYNPQVDRYFGNLPKLINEAEKQSSVMYLAYLDSPYRKMIQKILKEKSAVAYIPIFSLLHVSDYAWALSCSLKELFVCALAKKKEFHIDESYKPLLQEVFLHDISFGGYLHNLLVYKSIQRASVKCKIKKIIYPFENKSLEKMILMGVAQLESAPKTIGYQHTSITPRHLTFLFEPNEVDNTPLPDKIVTVGDITKQFLTNNGGYPKGLINSGCALRQKWSEPYPRNVRKKAVNILLALSSSKFELIQSVKYFQEIIQSNSNIKLGIRPHVTFNIDLLPHDLSVWVKECALDLSDSSLDENLKWCDITVYVSSTVALESMMRGKPIININIGDYLSPDPVLGNPEFYFVANDAKEFLNYVDEISILSKTEYEYKRNKSIEYVKQYLSPISDDAIQEFL
jgi:hypothetical protein